MTHEVVISTSRNIVLEDFLGSLNLLPSFYRENIKAQRYLCYVQLAVKPVVRDPDENYSTLLIPFFTCPKGESPGISEICKNLELGFII